MLDAGANRHRAAANRHAAAAIPHTRRLCRSASEAQRLAKRASPAAPLLLGFVPEPPAKSRSAMTYNRSEAAPEDVGTAG
eukprot:354711-Chlamydomonas_euryale.AAC.2